MSARQTILHLCLILGLQAGAIAQPAGNSSTDTLAEVGGSVIAARDLLERLDLMPWPAKERPGWADSVKARALQSLVAERLLATEATERGLGTDPASARRIRALERVLVRDELYRREILARVQVSRTELEHGMRLSTERVRVLLLTCDSRENAARARQLLERSAGDSTARAALDAVVQRMDTLSFTFGAVERQLEDAAYSLQRRLAVAGPVQIEPPGWTIILLLERTPNTKFTGQSLANRTSKTEATIRRRNEIDLTRKYTASVLSSKRAESNPETFELLAGAAWSLLAADSSRYARRGGYDIGVLADAIEQVLGPHLGDPLVATDEEPLLLGDVLDGFRTLQFVFPARSRTDFLARLNDGVKEVVAIEYLAREGLRLNLQHTGPVRRGIATWTSYWNAHSVERLLRDSVTVNEDELLSYLAEHGSSFDPPYEVTVREVFTDSIQIAVRLMEETLHGADLAEIARRHSTRRAWAGQGGKSPWFRVSAIPDIGFYALAADSGELVGPVRVRGGYSVFQLLGKRHVAGDTVLTLDSLKALAHREVLTEKGDRLLDRRVAHLARRYGVVLHHDRLRSVAMIPHNIVTRRVLGFGGSMLAVPPLPPRWQWILEGGSTDEALP